MDLSGHPEKRFWRRPLVAVAAVSIALPFLTAAPTSAGRPQEEYLLSIAGEGLSAVSADVTNSGGQVLQSFEIADALLVTLPAGAPMPDGAVAVPDTQMTFLAAPQVASSDPANTYQETIGVQGANRGEGVTVALVDTGVADTGEVDVEHVNVSGAPQGDGFGHGTFLAGIIAGDGSSSDGAYAGVAPDARVLDVQVAKSDGSTSLSLVLAGLQAVADRKATDPSVKVLSLALSTGSPLPPWVDPLTRGLEGLWSEGVTVIVAAGNDGAGDISSPASDPTLLAVGTLDENRTSARADDLVADFSSFDRMFGADRPDLVAPGVSLVSLRSPGSVADQENPTSRVGDKYFKGTGTSMSAALLAGSSASLVADRPSLSPNDVKRLVVGTAYGSSTLTRALGAGVGGLDLGKARVTDVSATPPVAFEPVSSRFAPDEADAATWAEFSAAWEAGNLRAAVAAWVRLSPQTRRWAANAWSLAILTRSLTMEEGDFLGRKWAGRKWATQSWLGRKWASDEWVGRKWAAIDWTGRKWASDKWLIANWGGRDWASQDWLAFAWTALASSDEIAKMWADEDWEGRKWAGRKWALLDWAGRKWASDAWEGRKWADFSWEGRKWAAGAWTGRKWAEFSFAGRKWALEQWAGRKWAVTGWGP